MRRSVKKRLHVLIAAAVLVGLAGLAIYLQSVFDYKRAVNEIIIEDVRISDVPDGVYPGGCDVGLIRAKVEVTVCRGRITEIKILEHKNERGQAAETVLEQIISKQEVDVDAVSGATNSSMVLKKTVEDALRAALNSCLSFDFTGRDCTTSHNKARAGSLNKLPARTLLYLSVVVSS